GLGICLTGCGGGGSSSTPVNSQPPTVALSVQPATLVAGATASLSWSSTNATVVSINNGIGEVAIHGSTTVKPAQTTQYKATASGPGGSTQAATTVTVNARVSLQF